MSQPADAPSGWQELKAGGQLPVFASLLLGIWLHAASSMLAATTLPRAVEEIGGTALVGWAFSLYQLGSILAGAATGLFVARFGLRRAFLLAGGLYGLGCLVSALAVDMPMMLGGRLLQGLGGGWMLALSYVALERLFPNHLLPRLIGVISVVWSVSAFCGPLVGGTFSTFGLWRLAFWAFAGQAGIFLAAVLWLMPRDQGGAGAAASGLPMRRLLVLASAILMVGAAGAEVRPLISPLLCLGGLALLWAFFRLDARVGVVKMFPSRPLSLATPLGAGLVMVFMLSAASMSFLVYGPFLLDRIYGVTPLAAGYIVALESIGWGLASIVVSSLGRPPEGILIRLGPLVFLASLLGFAVFMPVGPLWAIILCALAAGAGFGMMWPFVVRRVIAAAPPEERDRASAAQPTTQQMGFALGAAAAGIVANGAGFAEAASLAVVENVALWVFAAFVPLVLIGVAAAWRLAR
ncbi:MAG: MFS transporter [Pseudomonadota bacterium]